MKPFARTQSPQTDANFNGLVGEKAKVNNPGRKCRVNGQRVAERNRDYPHKKCVIDNAEFCVAASPDNADNHIHIEGFHRIA